MDEKLTYNADSINLYEDIDHIRLRPGMYIGATDDPRHLLVEVIDNAMDEVQNGYATKVVVKVDSESNKYTVTDNGRGIPVGYKVVRDNSIPVLQAITQYAKSGGKFDNTAYKIGGGLHGVGLSVVTALCNSLSIKACNESIDKYHSLEYSRKYIDGYEELSSELYKKFEELPSDGITHGTVVEFTPCDNYFSKNSTNKFASKIIPIDFIKDKLRLCNAQYCTDHNVDLEFYYDDEKVDVRATWADIINRPNPDAVLYFSKLLSVTNEKGESATLYLEYNSDVKYSMVSFCNLLRTVDGGTHLSLANSTIENAWRPYLESIESVKMRSDDCRVGLYGAISVAVEVKDFNSQTKDKLSVPKETMSDLFRLLEIELSKWIHSDDNMRNALLRRFELYRIERNRISTTKDIMSLIKISDITSDGKTKRYSVVRNLVECSSTSVEGTEIYIVEGDSAGGSAAQARDPKKQAVLPLRGKSKNVTGLSIKDALKHEEIRSIVNAAGCGVGDDCDPSKSRYEKYMISCDADEDGYHVAILVLNIFVNLLPNLVKAGMVYLVLAPFYSYTMKGKMHYADSYEELPESVKGTGNFTRFKGLGEMNADQYRATCMDASTRRIARVTYPDDLERFNEILGTSSGRRSLVKDLGLLVDLTNKNNDIEINESDE